MKINSVLSKIRATILFKRLALALIILSCARVIFWLFNKNQFPWSGIVEASQILFWGAYFDFITVFYCFSPFILLHLIPGKWFQHSLVQKGLRLFFGGILFLLLILTFIDAGYFPFSKTRLGIELFQMATSEEVSILSYIADYWFFVPIILILTYISLKLYPKKLNSNSVSPILETIINIAILALFIFTVRGGFRLKPLRSIDTALFVNASYAQLAISTGFNFLESFQVEKITVPQYFSQKELDQILKKDYVNFTNTSGTKQKNIVIIILESFGKEYTFPETDEAVSYSPFLSQLAQQSQFFNRAYSNGTRSVDAIPAILEGVPKLTKTDFMYSNYIKNITPGFPYYLKNKGYECAFYHGAKNGTLGLEAFLKSRGWQYYGKNEFSGNPNDFDGEWGIFDGPYLHYFAKQLNQLKSPFVAAVFTLSSHHPYTLPVQYLDSFKNIKQPIHKTIRYADNCLRDFFATIKNEPWFNETIFVITGDHSGENFTKHYQSSAGKYEVPLLIYDPQNPTHTVNESITQHIDIIPLVLERSGFSGRIFTLGTFSKADSEKMAFQNEDGNIQAITSNFAFTFDGSTVKLSMPQNAQNLTILRDFESSLKAKIQNYNYRLVNNKYW